MLGSRLEIASSTLRQCWPANLEVRSPEFVPVRSVILNGLRIIHAQPIEKSLVGIIIFPLLAAGEIGELAGGTVEFCRTLERGKIASEIREWQIINFAINPQLPGTVDKNRALRGSPHVSDISDKPPHELESIIRRNAPFAFDLGERF